MLKCFPTKFVYYMLDVVVVPAILSDYCQIHGNIS